MTRQTTEILVGAAVLAIAVGFAVFASRTAGFGSGAAASYPLHASFRSLEGVSEGSDVRLAGVKIGTVTEVVLNPETFRADTVVSVDSAIQIPDDSAIVIASEGLLGGNFVEIVPGGSPFAFEPGATVEDTQGAVSLISLLLKFVSGKTEE